MARTHRQRLPASGEPGGVTPGPPRGWPSCGARAARGAYCNVKGQPGALRRRGSDRAADWVSSVWLLTVAQSSGRKKKVGWPFCGIALMAWSYRRGSGFAFRRVESVIADDEPLDLLAFGLWPRGRGIVEHADD